MAGKDEYDKVLKPVGLSGATSGAGLGLINTRHESQGGLGGLSNALSGLLRPEVREIYYNRKIVVLDGYTFIGCRFDNCTLKVSTLNFDVINCVIDQSTVIEYGEGVVKPIRLFISRYHWASQVIPPYFRPQFNADGTITISKGASI